MNNDELTDEWAKLHKELEGLMEGKVTPGTDPTAWEDEIQGRLNEIEYEVEIEYLHKPERNENS